MKLLFVIESLHLGGAEKSLVTLLNKLKDKDFQIDLLIFKSGGELESDIPHYVHIIRKNIKIGFLDRIILKLSKLIHTKVHHAQLFRKYFLKNTENFKHSYDVAIAYNQGLATYYVSERIKANKKLAWINVEYTKAGYSIEKDIQFYRKFDQIVTVSKPACENFSEALALIGEKNIQPIVIKDITNNEEIRRKALSFDPKFENNILHICSVGRLVYQKNYTLAIKAASILNLKGYQFKWHIIGDGAERKQLDKLIDKFNLSEVCILYGSKKNPYPYIHHADIFVQTSKSEGLGLTVIEAKILQKPVVATAFAKDNGIIIHEKTGLISPSTPMSIAEHIERLINDIDLRQQISKQPYSVDDDEIKTLNLIENLIRAI